MKLENEFLCVDVVEKGAEVVRIYDKKAETDVLWKGDPAFWGRHSPILFPNVGRTWEHKVLIDGVEYPTSAHGFAKNHVFECVEVSEERLVLKTASSEETLKVYPYEFELTILYRLEGKELHVEWQVKNCSDKTMYFTIGGHPGIQFAKEGETKTDYQLRFPGKNSMECVRVDLQTATGLPDDIYTLELTDGVLSLKDELFAQDALVFDNYQFDEVWIDHKDGTPYVGMKCKDFYSFGIWSVKDAPFVCLEPWAGRCDNYGYEGEISQKPGINALDSGDIFVKGYTLIVA